MRYEFKEDDAYEFAFQQGIKITRSGDQLHFQKCPYCHGGRKRSDNKTFAINRRTGQFQCLRAGCGAKGNMITLSKDFGFSLGNDFDEYYAPKKQFRKFKKPTEPVVPKDSAVAYLKGRGISEEVARTYEITVKKDTENILVFPFYDDKENLCFIKYRKTDFDKEKDKNKEWCEAECQPILFGMKQCVDFGTLIVTEGQLDSLSVIESGINNAVSVPTGAKGFTWVPYCYDWVNKFDEIIVFGDFEKGKMSLLDEIADRFPKRVKKVREQDYKGCKDANEILQKFGKAAVKEAVENAELLPIKKVIPLEEVEDMNIFKMEKVRTGIKELDATLYGGLPFGQLVIVGGKRGDGKSTLSSQISISALAQNYGVFVYSGELPNYLFKAWFDFQIAGPKYIIEEKNGFGDINRFITKQNLEKIKKWYSGKAFIYDNRIVQGDEKEDLIQTIKDVIQQYGVRVILIDNLMTAMYLDEVKGSDKYDQQGRFVRKLTEIAVEKNVLILLVAHRRKNAYAQNDTNDEISGSGDITNLAGITLSYDRGTEKEGYRPDQRKLVVAKNRLFGKINLNGIVLDYDEKSKRIYSNDDELNHDYGWSANEDGFRDIDDEMEDFPY